MAKSVKPLPDGGQEKARRKPNSARLAKLVIQRRTLALLLVFGVAAFLALFAKAYDLTITQHNQLQDGASSQQMRSTVISASRGSILDRNGVTLAVSASADNVFLNPRAIEKYAGELDKKRAQMMVDGLKEGEKLPMSGQEYKDLLAVRLAEILDITEEKVRLANHCNYFREVAAEEEGVGRKLGFIAQEMGREINTMGSKANESNIQILVVKMKDELEKIKEQVLNIL